MSSWQTVSIYNSEEPSQFMEISTSANVAEICSLIFDTLPGIQSCTRFRLLFNGEYLEDHENWGQVSHFVSPSEPLLIVRQDLAASYALDPCVVAVEEAGIAEIHLAIKMKVSDTSLLACFRDFPTIAKGKNGDGVLPLHLTLRYRSPEVVVLAALQAFPDAALEKDNFGMLPLHLALERQCSDAIVQALFQAFPKAAQLRDEFGVFPLHWALKKRASDSTVELLLNEFPDAATHTDAKGKLDMLPLSIALENGMSKVTVHRLIREYPEAMENQDKFGMFPLHWALKSCAPEATVQAILKANPGATKGKVRRNNSIPSMSGHDISGMLPLHLAIVEGASNAIVKALLQEFPDATKMKDDQGMLPQHHARQHKSWKVHLRYEMARVIKESAAQTISEFVYGVFSQQVWLDGRAM